MYEITVVNMDEETMYDPDEVNVLSHSKPLEENFLREDQPDVKVLTSAAMFKCHDRQIQRLQRDQSKRIQGYQNLRQNLEVRSNDLQEQINELREELTLMQRKTVEIESMRHRIVNCEEQNVQMQIHNDSEFEILRDVMQHVCGRIDRMEELQQAEKAHFEQHQQQTLRASIIKATLSAQTSAHAHSPPQDHAHSPGQSNLVYYGPYRSPRSPCPLCHKDLAKNYVKSHLKFNRCKQPVIIVSDEIPTSTET